MAHDTRPSKQGRTLAIHENELKICDLCGGLNLETNEHCFVCGWHGRFEREPKLVRAALELASRRHGRLELQHLTDRIIDRAPTPLPLKARLRLWFSRLKLRFRR